jgi:hypothetical protein
MGVGIGAEVLCSVGRQVCVFVYKNLFSVPETPIPLVWQNEILTVNSVNFMSEKYVKNKGGRPKVSDARYREHVVSTRLDAVEHLRLEELKMRSGKSAADVIRELITRGYVRERMRRVHLDLMAQLKGIARNLNQLTRLANAVGYGSVSKFLQPLVAEIMEILTRFRDDR